jgi:hypothetical protein
MSVDTFCAEFLSTSDENFRKWGKYFTYSLNKRPAFPWQIFTTQNSPELLRAELQRITPMRYEK